MLTPYEKAKLEALVASVNNKTAGKLSVVCASCSDEYMDVSLLWAASFALSVPLLLFVFAPQTSFADMYKLQLISFGLLAIGLRWKPLLIPLVPRALRYRSARRLALAHKAKWLEGMHNKGTVFVFISQAERYAEVIADAGFGAKQPDDFWQRIESDLNADIRAGRMADGLEKAIKRCGDALTQHVPAKAKVDTVPVMSKHVWWVDSLIC